MLLTQNNMPINASPLPQSGVWNPWGMVPGPIDFPDPNADLSGMLPWLPGATGQAGTNIMAGLRGELSPELLAMNQSDAARFATQTGMPGTNAIPGTLPYNKNQLSNIRSREQLQQQAFENLNQFTTNVAQTRLLSPSEQAAISNLNSINRAVANPTLKGLREEELFNAYLRMIGQRMGGPGTGTLGTPFNPAGRSGQTPRPITPPAPGMDVSSQLFADQLAQPDAGWGVLTGGGQTFTAGNVPAFYLPDPGITTNTDVKWKDVPWSDEDYWKWENDFWSMP